MATFVVPEEKKTASRRCEPAIIEAQQIVLGCGSECDIKIKDYVIAPRHVRILETPDGFVAQDLGTGSGTFVDGRPVTDLVEISDGSEIILGISRFTAQVDLTAKKLTLTRTDFHFDYQQDPLAWSRSEVRLGKLPLLRWGSWATVALIVGLLAYWGWTGWSTGILEPGALRHAALVAATPDGNWQNCELCHTAGERVATAKCLGACHDDMADSSRHPFGRWADFVGPLAGSGLPAKARQESCLACHSEHRSTILPPLEATREACERCHGAEVPAAATAALAPTQEPVLDRLEYNTFSHAKHAAKHREGKLDCGHCHVRAALGDETLPLSEFRRVTFERCMECHERGRVDRPVPGTDFVASWHGIKEDRGAKCLQCHDQLHAKGLVLKPRARVATGRRFRLESRTHQVEAKAAVALGVESCSECHQRGVELDGGRLLVERSFDHATHVTAPNAEDECTRCHLPVVESSSLQGVVAPYDAEHCGECHATKLEAMPATGAATALPAAAAEQLAPVFPHDRHRSIEGGCSACHALDPALRTFPEARGCMGKACHDRKHERIGGGYCGRCHELGELPTATNDDPVFSGALLSRRRPSDPAFGHWSPGHSPLMDQGKCGECHDSKSTWAAERIDAVAIPTEAVPACRKCHVGSRARFHWR